MNKLISAIRRRPRLGEAGNVTISFAFIAPLMIVLSVAIIEFTLVMLDYSRANEATRRALRTALTASTVIADLSSLEGSDVICKSTSGTVTCTTTTVADATAFSDIVNSAQEVLPDILPKNIEVAYRFSGMGAAESGGIMPLITVSLRNLKHDFFLMKLIPGLPVAFTFPAFSATNLGPGYVAP